MLNLSTACKSNKLTVLVTLVAVMLLSISIDSEAEEPSRQIKVSKELTTLFRAARAVISANQKKINDPNIGNKGITSNFAVSETKENFKKATGKEFRMADASSNLGKAQRAIFDAISSVINQAQPLINEKGKGFKGFLPAVFAKQVADSFSRIMKDQMSIKLTAPKAYVRNLANRPDSWERNVIESKFKSPNWEFGKWFAEANTIKGKDAFRFILPEYYSESCLGCHGGPKGDIDITGGKKEGGKLNELGGAISFVIYKQMN